MTKSTIEEIVQVADDSIRLYTAHLEFLRKMVGITEEAITVFNDIIPNTDNSSFEEMKRMHSFNSLLTISLLDLFVICKKLVTAENDWEKLFFIKHGYLLIYETIDTFNSHNQEISKLIETQYTTLKNDYSAVIASLKRFKKVYSSENNIKDIRHNIAGHIDNNFITYYDTAIAIKGKNETDAILAFIEILKQLESISFAMETLSKNEALEKLEQDGMGKTIEEIEVNFDKKVKALRLLIEEKILNHDKL